MVYRILKRHDTHFELQYQDALRRWTSATRENPFKSELDVYDHMIAKGLDVGNAPPELVTVPLSHGGLTSRT